MLLFIILKIYVLQLFGRSFANLSLFYVKYLVMLHRFSFEDFVE
jgi:hypothetical protein